MSRTATLNYVRGFECVRCECVVDIYAVAKDEGDGYCICLGCLEKTGGDTTLAHEAQDIAMREQLAMLKRENDAMKAVKRNWFADWEEDRPRTTAIALSDGNARYKDVLRAALTKPRANAAAIKIARATYGS